MVVTLEKKLHFLNLSTRTYKPVSHAPLVSSRNVMLILEVPS